MQLKPLKCSFFQEGIEFLGHVISHNRLEMPASECDAVSGFDVPLSQTAVCSFSGLAGVYRRFVPGFTDIVAPLTRLLREDVPSVFSSLKGEELRIFHALKQLLQSPRVLARKCAKDSQLVLQTDASKYKIGCMML